MSLQLFNNEDDTLLFQELIEQFETLKKIGVGEKGLTRFLNEFHVNPLLLINLDNTILFTNSKFCNLVGYDKSELVGNNILTLFDEEEKEKIKQKLLTRKAGIEEKYRNKFLAKNGKVIFAETVGVPTLNEADLLTFSFGIITDLTDVVLEAAQKEEEQKKLEEEVEKRTLALSIANYHMVAEIKERKSVEEALKESEKRFKDLFLNSPEAVFVQDFNGYILDLNDAAAILHGFMRDDMIGRNVSEFVKDNSFEGRQSKIITGELNYFDVEIVHSSGNVIPIAVKSSFIEYNGKLSVILHARDISARKQYEENLLKLNLELDEKVKLRTEELEREISFKNLAQDQIKKQNEFLQSLLDINPNIIFVKNKKGQIVQTNKSFNSFFVINNSDVLGKFESDFIADQSFLEESKTQDIIAFSRPDLEFEFSAEVLIDQYNRKFYFKVSKQAVIAPSSGVMNVVTVMTNITELKEKELRIQNSERLYRHIARNVPHSAIYVFDKNLVYHLAEGPLVGTISLPKEQIEGRHVLDTGEDQTLLKERERRYKRIIEGSSEISQLDEFGRSYLVNSMPIKDKNEEVIFGLVVIMDVTDLKKAQVELEEKNEKLKRSNDELEKFAYVASHDLQSPLKTIISFLQLLNQRNGVNLDEEGREFMNIIISSSSRMRNLITDLLNYSRLNSVPRSFEEANINHLVKVITLQLESNIKAKNAIISYDNLPTILAEPYMLSQLFQNIIDNGMKFTKEGQDSHIEILYQDDKTHHHFLIKDNGIGIKEEFKDKIFQIFQRLHTDTEYTGTGIGLAICKKVINHHSGDIWIESEYGKGTTFHFTIKKALKNEKA
jgi:PAS domain S-box-containing protein